MPDLLLRDISEALAQSVKLYARDRGLTLNQAVLQLLEAGLQRPPSREENITHMAETRTLGGIWNSDESSAFNAAVRALERIPK